MTDRRPLIAGNWKLNHTRGDATALVRDLRAELGDRSAPEIAVAPVFTVLDAVRRELEGSPIHLAAQDVHWEDHGAFTGEVSPPFLKDVGCSMCIVGHSERRQYHGETDVGVSKKTRALLRHGLIPIVCVGETQQERDDGDAERVVAEQVKAGLEDISAADAAKLVLAYEPVWAIGTGKTAGPEDAQEMHASIRAQLTERFGRGVAEGCRILYGGSIKPDNAEAIFAQPDVDGGLVGGASLEAASFVAIVDAATR